MKSLGKIVLFLIFITLGTLNGGVIAKVDSQSVSVGEMITLSLTISGEDVKKPSIYKVCGYDIVSSSSQTSIKMINLDYQKNYILSYKFMPQKSCTIDAIEVEIDGKVEKTEPIKIEVSAMSKTISSDFELVLKSDKKEVFVGEPFDLTLLFKQSKSISVVDSKFVAPELKGFWVKGESQPARYNEGKFTVTKIIYTMAPQREGNLKITPAQMRIATRGNTRDSWGSWRPNVKWKAYFSNDLDIKVSALPTGIDLVGDFKINASVDKREINSNEAVNITLSLSGSGNFEDVKSFKPYIKGVSVFDEKIELKQEGLSQKIAFVSDSDFTIPAFTLRYFNPQTKEIKNISTQEIKIKVNGSANRELVLKKEESKEPNQVTVIKEEGLVETKTSYIFLLIVFVLGLILGMAIMHFNLLKTLKREKVHSLKDPKVLLIKLMPYKDDVKVQELIEILEKNLYSNAKIEIDKKVKKELIEKYSLN